MINTNAPPDETSEDDARVDEIVASGPHGAIVVAGIATAVVMAMWLLFYLLVFIPRSGV
jgi:hypothetical protein